MFITLLIIYLVLFTVLAWRRLDWAICLIVFALPSYLIRFEVFGVPATLLEGMILILFAIWLTKKYKIQNLKFKIKERSFFNNYKLRITRPHRLPDQIGMADAADYGLRKNLVWPVGLFLLAATVSVFIAPESQAAAGIWKAYFIEPVLFFIVFINTIKTKEQARNIIWVLGLSLVIPGLLAIYQKLTGSLIPVSFWAAADTRRVTSVYGYPNAIGLYFAPILTLLIGMFAIKLKNLINSHAEFSSASKILKQVQNDKNKWLKLIGLGLIILIGALSVLFAVSKGAVLAVGLGLFFYVLFWQKFRAWFAGLIIVGLVAAFFLAPQLVSLEGEKTVAGGGSLEVRIEQWGESLQMLSHRPIFGAGLSGYQERVAPFHAKDYIEIFMYPHQVVLNFWSEIGLLGLMAFIWLVVVFYKKLFSNNRLRTTDYGLPIGGAVATLLVHGLVDVPYFKNDLSVLFWVLFGLMIVIYQKQKTLQYNLNC